MNGNPFNHLLSWLLEERGVSLNIPESLSDKRRLLRMLMNTRAPLPLPDDIMALQDMELSRQRDEKNLVAPCEIPESRPRIRLWQGDITCLKVDAIINAANSALLGCFSPLHNCIDNIIHSAAGMQLRWECNNIMRGGQEPIGQARITPGYNLPAKWVIHTVGPAITDGLVTSEHQRLLESSYKSCLSLAFEKGLQSIAFCCISTGVFNFPRELAARIAIRTVENFCQAHKFPEIVIFNVFKDTDLNIYRKLLYNE